MIPSQADPRVCVFAPKCDYPVGPVESKAQVCLEQPYSDSRVVPEFSDDDLMVDWRKW